MIAQKSLESIALTDAEFYQAVRNQIVHEDDLIAQRLSWLVSSQSFLFTVYAIALSGLAPDQNRIEMFERQLKLIWKLIPFIAISTTGLIYCGILAGVLAMQSLRVSFQKQFGRKGDSIVPAVQGNVWTLLLGHAAPLVLPVILTGVWCVIWLRGGG